MKRLIILLIIIGFGSGLAGCTSSGYNAQKGAAIGGGLGAIAGQLIGNNTAGTLIGTSVGTFVGFIAGNAVDQYNTNQHLQQLEQKQTKQRAYASVDGQGDSPPGEWVQTKGQWIDGNWVPSYKKWVPVNP